MRKFLLSLRYARREMRAGLKGFYVFLACLILGVASIAAVQSLERGMMDSLHYDGRYILGGDIALRTVYEPPTSEQIRFLRKNIGPLNVIMEGTAMARRTDEKEAALVELKAVDVFYPLYGTFEYKDAKGETHNKNWQDALLTSPQKNDADVKDDWGALAEKELLDRLKIKIGDFIYVGKQKFEVRGVITREPDRLSSARFSLAPRLMISRDALGATGLRDAGNQIYYDTRLLVFPFARTPDDLKAAQDKITAAFPKASWKGRNCFNASPQLERTIKRLTAFLTLIGLSTLLIGGVGIQSAVKSYLQTKLPNIATLKCLGGEGRFIFITYLLQIILLACIGTALGVALGVGVSQVAGSLIASRFSLSDKVGVYPDAVAIAAIYGLLIALLFSLWPLGRALRTAPSQLFRDTVAPSSGKPSLNIMLCLLILAQALALAVVTTVDDRKLALTFTVGAAGVFAVFLGFSAVLKFALRHARAPRRPALRLAFANLSRPGNITSGVVLSLGIGLTVLMALALVQSSFSSMLREQFSQDAPSFFFMDVRPEEKDGFTHLLKTYPSACNIIATPSLRGRIIAVNGQPPEKMLKDASESWVTNSDRGLTYARTLPEHSKVVEGAWWAADYQGEPLVSIATNVAKAFGIGAGDSITVNIMGAELTAKVANVREIDWTSLTMNFAITFAPGTIDRIPSNYLMTVVFNEADEAAAQVAIAKQYPSVTAVRVKDALQQAQGLLKSAAQAVAVGAGVTLLAGTLVLAGGIASARRRHVYDAVILKVLGAQRRDILKAFLYEYALLAFITAFISAGLGTACGWWLLRRVMDLPWHFDGVALVLIALFCLGVTLIAGFFGTAQALRQKPAPYLRNQ